jgi:hypothetical protein
MFGQSDSCFGATVFFARRKHLGEEQGSSSFLTMRAADSSVRRTRKSVVRQKRAAAKRAIRVTVTGDQPVRG